VQGGTAPSLQGAPSTANPNGIFRGPGPGATQGVPGPFTISQSGTDNLLTQGLRNLNNAPAVATFTGILTDPQFRVVLRALEQREGTDLLSAPKITTVSGRQAHMEAVEPRTIVVGNQTQFATGGGAIGAGGLGAVGG